MPVSIKVLGYCNEVYKSRTVPTIGIHVLVLVNSSPSPSPSPILSDLVLSYLSDPRSLISNHACQDGAIVPVGDSSKRQLVPAAKPGGKRRKPAERVCPLCGDTFTEDQ